MKKRMICLISAVCLLAGILPVPILAEGNPYQHYETYTYGGTEYTTVTDTYYAWQQVYDRLGISLPDFGTGCRKNSRKNLIQYLSFVS